MIPVIIATGGRRRDSVVADPNLIIDYDFTAMTSLPVEFTFTSVAGGTYYDISGVQQTASANQPRFDHDPTTHEPLGLRFDATPSDTATRSLTGTGFNGSTFTMVVDYMLPNSNGTLGRLVGLDNATADGTERSATMYTSSAAPQPNFNLIPQYRPAGTNLLASAATATNGAALTLQRFGLAIASDDVGFCQNGTEYSTGATTVTVPLAATTMRLGNLAAANRPFIGWLRRVRIYDVRKSNTDLATLTTVP